jgi:hypothetical protein
LGAFFLRLFVPDLCTKDGVHNSGDDTLLPEKVELICAV